MTGPAVTVVASGGLAVTDTVNGVPVTQVESGGMAITLVDSGGLPLHINQGGGASLTLDALPQSGLIAEWRFTEGSGTTVADQKSTYPIDLTTALAPQNVTWQSYGVSLASGGIETPSIVGARTIVLLYRTPEEQSGFLMAGPVASNAGPLLTGASPSVVATEINHIGQLRGVAPIAARESDGVVARRLASDGWRVHFRELAAGTNGAIAFGTRRASTLNRVGTMEIAACVVYNRTLSAAERNDIYAVMRDVSAARGVPIDTRDCATQASGIFIGGQSNADGRALISGLSALDQARTYTKTKIILNNSSGTKSSFADLDLGLAGNHTVSSGTTQFGPEIPIANQWEDNKSENFYIVKAAQGGTYLAPISVTGAAISWSTDEPKTVAGFWHGLLNTWWRAATDLQQAGIGLNLDAFIWYQGEQDSILTAAADIYGVQLEQLIDNFDLYSGVVADKVFIVRIRDTAPPDPTGYATVRAAQAAVVATLNAGTPGRATLVDVDSYGMGDSVHLNATGMQSLGAYLYGQIYP